MQNKTKNIRIGILPGMADLYNRLFPELSRLIKDQLNQLPENLKINDIDYFISDIVCTKKQVEAEYKNLITENVDLIIVALAPYCPSGVLTPTLIKSDLPLLIWPIQNMFRLEPEKYDLTAIMLNHGVHGVQDLANVLRRSNRDYGVIHGHWRQKDFAREILCWAQAAKAVCAMKKSNPIQIGGHFEDMLDLQIGSEQCIRKIGMKHKTIPMDEFYKIWTSAQQEQIRQCTKSYNSIFEISSKIENDMLEKAARGEVALRTIIENNNSAALGLNFLELCNDSRIAEPLHVAGSVLMNEGLGYAGEGDWVTAGFIYAMQQAFGVASFSEIFSVGYDDNRLVLKHWGEGNFALARLKPKLSLSEFNDKQPIKFAVVDFEFAPGEATLANFNSTPDGTGQIISIVGSVTEDSLPKADGPRAVFKPNGEDVRKILTDFTYKGGSHHLALISGNGKNVLEKMCKLAGWVCISL